MSRFIRRIGYFSKKKGMYLNVKHIVDEKFVGPVVVEVVGKSDDEITLRVKKIHV